MSNRSEKMRLEAKFNAACRRLKAANDEVDEAERDYRLTRQELDDFVGGEPGEEGK